MKLIRGVRLVGLSALLAGGLLVSTGTPASAKLIERSHEHIVFTIPDDEVCGISVVTTIDIINNFHVRLGKNGFPLFQVTGVGTVTFTNPVNGKSVENQFAGASKDLTVVDNGDGTITVRTAVTGLAQRITSSDGTAAIMDVGRVVFVGILDYNGTPADTEDDIFLSGYVESISGPHPDLESDFALFCEEVIPALT